MYKAKSVVKWFSDNGTKLHNSFDGNLIVNKMLVFAQLISIAKDNKKLFNEDLYAFKHGVVVEDIRLEYRNSFTEFVTNIKNEEYNFNEDEYESLEITKKIFGQLDAYTLSELTHQFEFWKEKYDCSTSNGYYNKESSKINLNDLNNKYSADLEKIKALVSLEQKDDHIEECLNIKGVDFYYNPKETYLDITLMKELESFPASESAYSFYIDESQGLVVF